MTQPLHAEVVRIDGQYGPQYRTLRHQCLNEAPTMWHIDCKTDLQRTDDGYVTLLNKHYTREDVCMLGFLADGALQGMGFTYRRPEKGDWFLGGLYIAPAFRGPLKALGDNSAVDHLYTVSMAFAQTVEPKARMTALIRRGNVASINVAKRHGFKCVTAVRNVPNMAGGKNDVLHFRRRLGD